MSYFIYKQKIIKKDEFSQLVKRENNVLTLRRRNNNFAFDSQFLTGQHFKVSQVPKYCP